MEQRRLHRLPAADVEPRNEDDHTDAERFVVLRIRAGRERAHCVRVRQRAVRARDFEQPERDQCEPDPEPRARAAQVPRVDDVAQRNVRFLERCDVDAALGSGDPRLAAEEDAEEAPVDAEEPDSVVEPE